MVGLMEQMFINRIPFNNCCNPLFNIIRWSLLEAFYCKIEILCIAVYDDFRFQPLQTRISCQYEK